MQVFNVPGTDVDEHLRILTGIPCLIGCIQGVVNGFLEQERHQVSNLHIHVTIND